MGDAVEFKLPGPEYEGVTWVHNEHFTASIGPLELSLRALRERTNADGLPSSIYINGYGFGREPNIRPATEPQDESIVLGWRERRMPAVDAVCAELEAFAVESVAPGQWRTTLEAQEARFWDAFGVVHRDTMGQVFPASALWVELYTKRFGEDAREDALAMLAGFPNASSQRAAALWDLGRVAASDPRVLAAVEGGALPDDESAPALRFRALWDALLDDYGFTTTTHLVDLPTWREDPSVPLRMIAAMARESEDRDPRLVEQRAAARRVALEAALAAADSGEDDEVSRLRQVYRVARHLAPASEDHNLLCDQRMIAAARTRWLAIGAHLVARGLLPQADDIFYLSLDELVDALEQGTAVPAATLSARREEQAQWRAASPPSRLGAGTAATEGPRSVRGTAASAGVHRGRARVIVALPDAVDLQPGDVLVCPATSPEWTPYFGVVGALVTGTGSLLAHAAVVAREFGIPAVVGAAGAMSLIPDGAFVRVDGSRGIVTIED